jgi:hypothetical protein
VRYSRNEWINKAAKILVNAEPCFPYGTAAEYALAAPRLDHCKGAVEAHTSDLRKGSSSSAVICADGTVGSWLTSI